MPGVVKYAYKEIGITITEYAVMELLLIHWYQSDGLPEVGLNVLARELGKSKVQIWRHLKKLQQKGLLSIIHIFDQDGGQRNNRYDITPFVQKLEVFVHQNMGDIAENFVPETSDSVAVDALHVVATVQNTPSIDPVVAVEVETALVGSAGSVGVELVSTPTEPTEPTEPTMEHTMPMAVYPEFTSTSRMPSMELSPSLEQQITPEENDHQDYYQNQQQDHHPNRTPIRKQPSIELPPPALGPKTAEILAARAMVAKENDVHVSLIQQPEEPKEPQQTLALVEPKVPKASKTKKVSKASKKKKEQPEDVQKQPPDSAEIARKLISIYANQHTVAHHYHPSTNTDVDTYPHPSNNANVDVYRNPANNANMDVYRNPASNVNVDTYPDPAIEAPVTEGGQKDTGAVQVAIIDPDRPMRFTATLTEQVRSAVAFFAGTESVIRTREAYKIITRIFKKLREIQLVNEYSDEDIESACIWALNDTLRYVKEELKQEKAQSMQRDQLAFFLNTLDLHVEEIREEVANEWIECLLKAHDDQFPDSPFGIAQPQLLDVPPWQAILEPRSLLVLEDASLSAPTGIKLVKHLHHYGLAQPRRIEYMLMSNNPDPGIQAELQDLLRMRQLNDERDKLQQVSLWKITGNTLQSFLE
jgi:hypothetical protein